MKVLVWIPKGAGQNSGTPGKVAIKVFSRPCFNDWEIDLYHGNPALSYVNGTFSNIICNGDYRGRLGQLRFLRAARAWLENYGRAYDAFIGMNAYHATVYPARWFSRLGRPAIVRVAGHMSDLATRRDLSSLLGFPRRRRNVIKREISAVIAVSQTVQDELVSYGLGFKTIYIPNAVDPCIFHPDSEVAKDRSGRPLRVLYVGAMNEHKRPHWILPALRLAIDNGISCEARFLGAHDPAYIERFRLQVRRLSLEDKVSLLHHVDDVEVHLRASDIFAFPSRKEGMSNAVLEAMASGLPVVATNYAGAGDVIANGVDGLLTSGGEADFTDGLFSLLCSPQRRMALGLCARRRVLLHHDIERQAESYRALISRLVDQSRSGHSLTSAVDQNQKRQ